MGRPRTPLLDLDRIGQAALAVVDETGEVSLPQVARRLGVRTASLYHHVEGREGVIELIRAHIARDIDCATLADRPWEVGLAGWARSYRTAFAAHPRAIPLLLTTTVRTPRSLADYEAAVGLLLEAGFAVEEALIVLAAVENVVLGSALDLAAPDPIWQVTAETPALARAVAAAPPDRSDAAFDLALEAVLSHVKRMRDRPPSAAR
ncbi:TetR/AcrR family transcriptional regulator C-terminal domain-containing protein [Nonomuraea typhae]|uniref:TetR/AcrR family transcriptional regulator C-terminal domain-containing protein n=1 Tax=Nonomuraea typhae TaxID=2603600 RepID=UPI0012F7E984|nr:TetR/AcrR family transcriptional regulator C-terminal domain-containing protein [Nonomuraea typhae]